MMFSTAILIVCISKVVHDLQSDEVVSLRPALQQRSEMSRLRGPVFGTCLDEQNGHRGVAYSLFTRVDASSRDAWAKHRDLDSYEAKWLYVDALMKVWNFLSVLQSLGFILL